MQRGDLGFIVSRLLSVLLLIQAFQYTLSLALIAGTIGKYQMAGELAVQVIFCVAHYVIGAFLWFRAELFAGGTTRAKISIENPATFQRILFGAIGLYFLVAGAANLIDSLWWEVIAKSQFTAIIHPPTSHVADIARTVIGFILLLLNGSKVGSR